MALVMLQRTRLCFPHLFEARRREGDDGTKQPTFGAAFLIEPKSSNAQAIVNAMAEAARDKWGEKAEVIYKQLRATDKVALHDGNNKADDYPEYGGMLYVNAYNRVRPLAIDHEKNLVAAQDGVLYSGCYVNARCDIWAMDNHFGKRISAMLLGVQFAGHGEALGGTSVAQIDDFDVVEGVESAAPPGDGWGTGGGGNAEGLDDDDFDDIPF
jgi:hypothetical protein